MAPVIWTIEIRYDFDGGRYEASVKEIPDCIASGEDYEQAARKLGDAMAELLVVSALGAPDAMQWGYREHPDEDPEVEPVSEKYARFRAQDEHLTLVRREVRYGPWVEVPDERPTTEEST